MNGEHGPSRWAGRTVLTYDALAIVPDAEEEADEDAPELAPADLPDDVLLSVRRREPRACDRVADRIGEQWVRARHDADRLGRDVAVFIDDEGEVRLRRLHLREHGTEARGRGYEDRRME